MGTKDSLWTRLARWLSYRLPRKVLYFAVVRAWVESTTGKWSDIDATAITVSDVLTQLHINTMERHGASFEYDRTRLKY